MREKLSRQSKQLHTKPPRQKYMWRISHESPSGSSKVIQARRTVAVGARRVSWKECGLDVETEPTGRLSRGVMGRTGACGGTCWLPGGEASRDTSMNARRLLRRRLLWTRPERGGAWIRVGALERQVYRYGDLFRTVSRAGWQMWGQGGERTNPCVLPLTETKKVEGEIDFLQVVGRVGDKKISPWPSTTADASAGVQWGRWARVQHRVRARRTSHLLSESLYELNCSLNRHKT